MHDCCPSPSVHTSALYAARPAPTPSTGFLWVWRVALPSPANLVPFLVFAFFLLFFAQNGGGGECFCKLSVYFLFFLFVPKVIKLFGGVGQNVEKR